MNYVESNENTTVKNIKLKKQEYLFDLNTLLLPFAAEYKTKKKNKDGTYQSLIIDRITVEQDDNIITVDGGTQFGVPTLYDKKLLFALQRMFIKQKKLGNTFQLLDLKKSNIDLDNIPPSERTLDVVTVETIAREMGYKGNLSTSVKRKICDSIRRLNNATYRSKKGKIFMKKDKEYLMSAETAVRLIDDYKIVTFEQVEKSRREKAKSKFSKSKAAHEEYEIMKSGVFEGSVKIVLHSLIYKAMVCDQYLFYSLLNLNKINDETALTIYTLTMKWAGNKKVCTIKDETFLQYIVMRDDMDKRYKLRKIRQSIDKLNKTNLLSITELKNGSRFYDFRKTTDKDTLPNTDYMANEFNSLESMLDGYEALGIDREYISGHIQKAMNSLNFDRLKYLQALVRYATIRSKYKDSITDMKTFIKTYIETDKEIDAKYYGEPIMK